MHIEHYNSQALKCRLWKIIVIVILGTGVKEASNNYQIIILLDETRLPGYILHRTCDSWIWFLAFDIGHSNDAGKDGYDGNNTYTDEYF